MQFLIIACALLGVALGQFPGYQGYQGYPGYQGYQGYPGYAGYTGYQGYPGYTGYQGYKGYQGYPGYPGYQGYQGYNKAGYTGYPGLIPIPALVKPVADVKTTEVVKPVVPLVPVVPIAPKAAYNGQYWGIRSQSQDSAPDGSYAYRYETENGIAAAESGSPRITPDGQEEVVVGSYSYTAPDGTPIYVRYTADKNGFHPEGAHLPGFNGYVDGRSAVIPDVPIPAIIEPVVVPAEKPVEVKPSVAEKKE